MASRIPRAGLRRDRRRRAARGFPDRGSGSEESKVNPMSQLAIYNPANGEKIAEVPADDATSVAAKARQARAAQPAWALRSLSERKACIKHFREGVVRELES